MTEQMQNQTQNSNAYAQKVLANAKTKEERIAAYADIRKHYNQVRGLFRFIHAIDRGEAQTSRGLVHKFSYLATPAGAKNNDEGLTNDQFIWMNEMINVKGGSVAVIENRQEIVKQLAQPNVKSLRYSVTYKINHRGKQTYRDIHDVFDRNKKRTSNK